MGLLNRKTRAAEDFARLVDGQTPSRAYDAELAELVGVADTLRATDAVAPRPEFAASLRERLMAEAQSELQHAPIRLEPVRTEAQGKRTRRIAAGVSAALLVGGVAGVSAASQQAAPGDILYPIKRSVERITGSAGAETVALADADDRLAALQTLVEDGAGRTQVAAAVDRFLDAAQQGTSQATGPDGAARVERFIERSTTVLAQLSETADIVVRPELARASLAIGLLAANAD